MATLINGNGNPAVYAGQDADLYAGTIGAATRILNVGSKFAATIEDANTIAIADGVIVTKEGRRIQLDVGSIDEFLIPTGQAGTTRYYIIGYHLYTDGSANQLCETFVQLMNTSTETITENTFRGGFNEVYVSLYRVTQNGLTLNTPAALLSVSETIAQLRDKVNPAMQDILWYGTCATAAATQAKVATTTDRKLTNLTAGQKVAIKMTYNNTHASPTLNVDGKGAKSIKAYGTTAPKVWWKAGDVVTFVYDGTNWLMGVTAGEIEQINSDLTELSEDFSEYSTAWGAGIQLNPWTVSKNGFVYIRTGATYSPSYPSGGGVSLTVNSRGAYYHNLGATVPVSGSQYIQTQQSGFIPVKQGDVIAWSTTGSGAVYEVWFYSSN